MSDGRKSAYKAVFTALLGELPSKMIVKTITGNSESDAASTLPQY